MQKRLFFILSFLFLGNFLLGHAQSLPSEPQLFLPAFKKAILDEDGSKENKKYFEVFDIAWNSAEFTPLHKNFITVAQTMQQRKVKAVPTWLEFSEVVLAFYNNKVANANFEPWTNGLNAVVKKKSINHINNYLKFSRLFFEKNALSETSACMWYTRKPTYIIHFDPKTEKIYVEYDNIDLLADGRGDSTIIEGTTGVFYPDDNRFFGKGGRVYWEKAGMPKNKVYADLKSFQIDLRKAGFEADSVTFFNDKYLTQPEEGKFEEKLTRAVESEIYRYPKFDSYNARIAIPNISENVNYEGGFSFHGNKFVARGDTNNYAYLSFIKDGKLFIRIGSKNFTITDERFYSSYASLVMHLGDTDSITHPGLKFTYDRQDSIMTLNRDENTPFIDSYHHIEIFAEAIYWKTSEKFLSVGAMKGRSESNARFRSGNFFSQLEYERYQGVGEVNPIDQLRKFVLRPNKDTLFTFTALEFAKFLKLDLIPVRQMLVRLTEAGLVAYNSDNQTATVRERLFTYYNASKNKDDYDIIEIKSNVKKTNGIMSLLDFRLDIKGIEEIVVSDSQLVEIRPYGNQIIMKKNMDFDFSGIITAGRWGIFGKNFKFMYNDFKVVLSDVDSVRLVGQKLERNPDGNREDVLIRSTIEDLTGELLIDHPKNKSGKKYFPQYPRFISKKESFVYYQKPQTFNNVYRKSDFYFKLDPFEKDTLDNFKSELIIFDGEFVSAGIFPNLREKLIVMRDYSLGFFKVTDAKGLPAYGGKGTFTDTLTLSNKGLRGAGKIDYLTSEAWSSDFVFFPDSVRGHAYRFGIKKKKGGIETPDVKATNVGIFWRPKDDVFDATESSSPFEMYEGQSFMYGKLTLTPTGLEGDGRMNFYNADLTSTKFKYKSDDLKTDSAGFQISDNATQKQEEGGLVAFKTDNVKADISFKDKQGVLKSNSPNSFVEFPINRFKAYMDEMFWDMKEQKVDMNSKAVDAVGLRGALFVSTDKKLDSLSFIAPKSRFVVESKVITNDGVEYVDVADSRIFPADKQVIIKKDAKIDPLKNAKIWVAKTDKLHVLEKANITIVTSHYYSGNAEYQYIDELVRGQPVKFDTLYTDKNDITVAKGKIEPIQNFKLSPHFEFNGDVNLYGQNKFLTFNGYTRIGQKCDFMPNSWFRFESEIDPNNIFIPITDRPIDEKKNPLFNGFVFSADSLGLYPAIFSAKKRPSDYEVLKASGFVWFDKRTQEYKIGSKEKLLDHDLAGNFLRFHPEKCVSYGEGRMDLGAKTGQLTTNTAGSVTHEPKNDNITLDLLMSIDFKLESSLIKILDETLAKESGNEVDITDVGIKKRVIDILDSAATEKIYNQVQNGMFRRLPRELSKMFVFTDVNFTWNKKKKSFLHDGKVGIMVFNGKQINKSAQALIEINRRTAGDIINIYLEFDEDTWFYFSYRQNVMTLYSSKKEFNDALTAIDPAKRVFEEKGMPNYTLAIGTKRRVDKFKEAFQSSDAVEEEPTENKTDTTPTPTPENK